MEHLLASLGVIAFLIFPYFIGKFFSGEEGADGYALGMIGFCFIVGIVLTCYFIYQGILMLI